MEDGGRTVLLFCLDVKSKGVDSVFGSSIVEQTLHKNRYAFLIHLSILNIQFTTDIKERSL